MEDDPIKSVGRVIVTGERIEMPEMGMSFPVTGGGIHGDPNSDSDGPIGDDDYVLDQYLREHVERIQALEANENFKQLSKDLRQKLYENLRVVRIITDFYGKNGRIVVDGMSTPAFLYNNGKPEIRFGSATTMQTSETDAGFARSLLAVLHELLHFEFANRSITAFPMEKSEAYAILNSAKLLTELGSTLYESGALTTASNNYRNGYIAAQEFLDGTRSEQSVLDEIEQYSWTPGGFNI